MIMNDKSKSSSREKVKDNTWHANSSKDVSSSSKQTNNKCNFKLDSSEDNQYITYTTDLKLINKSREQYERIIYGLYKSGNFDSKPKTYRRKARVAYLDITKKRNKNKKQLRLDVDKQIRFLSCNLKIINKMLYINLLWGIFL